MLIISLALLGVFVVLMGQLDEAVLLLTKAIQYLTKQWPFVLG